MNIVKNIKRRARYHKHFVYDKQIIRVHGAEVCDIVLIIHFNGETFNKISCIHQGLNTEFSLSL